MPWLYLLVLMPKTESTFIINTLSPTSTPRFPSDALGGLVVVGVPPLSAFLSPPRPLRCRSLSSFSLRGGLSRLPYKWCIHAREGAVRSAPLVRSRQLSLNHHLSLIRYRRKTTALFIVFSAGWKSAVEGFDAGRIADSAYDAARRPHLFLLVHDMH